MVGISTNLSIAVVVESAGQRVSASETKNNRHGAVNSATFHHIFRVISAVLPLT
jgi:hypothetical protein